MTVKKNRINNDTPTLSLAELKQLEQSESGELSPNELAMIEQVKAMQAKLDAMAVAAAAANAKATEAELILRKQALDNETFNVLISSWDQKRTDLPRQGGLDIYVASSVTELTRQLSEHGDKWGRPVAWIPVLLYPQLKEDGAYVTKAGKSVPKLKLGQTVANESFANHTVVDPVTGKKRTVSLSCYATINCNVDPASGHPTDPVELAEKIERAIEKDEKVRRYDNGDPDSSPEIPAFIGYMQSQGLHQRLKSEGGRPAQLGETTII